MIILSARAYGPRKLMKVAQERQRGCIAGGWFLANDRSVRFDKRRVGCPRMARRPYIFRANTSHTDFGHASRRGLEPPEHFSRTVILLLAIATEIDNYFGLNNKVQLSGIWMTFIKQTEISEVESEVKEMYDLRYKTFLELVR